METKNDLSAADLLARQESAREWQSGYSAFPLQLEDSLKERGLKVQFMQTSFWSDRAVTEIVVSVKEKEDEARLVTVWARRTKANHYSMGIGKKGSDVKPLLLFRAQRGKSPVDAVGALADGIISHYANAPSDPSLS